MPLNQYLWEVIDEVDNFLPRSLLIQNSFWHWPSKLSIDPSIKRSVPRNFSEFFKHRGKSHMEPSYLS